MNKRAYFVVLLYENRNGFEHSTLQHEASSPHEVLQIAIEQLREVFPDAKIKAYSIEGTSMVVDKQGYYLEDVDGPIEVFSNVYVFSNNDIDEEE